MLKKLLFLVTLAAMLTACLPAAQPTADVQGQVNTAVAGTIQANEQIDLAVAQTVAAGEAAVSGESAGLNEVALQATNTSEPTFTPFVVASLTPTATPIPLKYTCSVFKKKPRDNENFNRNEKFDVKFIITNTGTRPWPKGIDFKFVGGTDLASPNRVEIPRALVPGETYEVVLDGQAPDKKGFYVMTYFVDGPMCYGYIAINVK